MQSPRKISVGLITILIAAMVTTGVYFGVKLRQRALNQQRMQEFLDDLHSGIELEYYLNTEPMPWTTTDADLISRFGDEIDRSAIELREGNCPLNAVGIWTLELQSNREIRMTFDVDGTTLMAGGPFDEHHFIITGNGLNDRLREIRQLMQVSEP